MIHCMSEWVFVVNFIWTTHATLYTHTHTNQITKQNEDRAKMSIFTLCFGLFLRAIITLRCICECVFWFFYIAFFLNSLLLALLLFVVVLIEIRKKNYYLTNVNTSYEKNYSSNATFKLKKKTEKKKERNERNKKETFNWNRNYFRDHVCGADVDDDY